LVGICRPPTSEREERGEMSETTMQVDATRRNAWAKYHDVRDSGGSENDGLAAALDIYEQRYWAVLNHLRQHHGITAADLP
jgi:hypothetical protein